MPQAYLVPRQMWAKGLRPGEITFADDTIRQMVQDYTREVGYAIWCCPSDRHGKSIDGLACTPHRRDDR